MNFLKCVRIRDVSEMLRLVWSEVQGEDGKTWFACVSLESTASPSAAFSFLVNYMQGNWSWENENCRKDVRQDLPFRIETIESN